MHDTGHIRVAFEYLASGRGVVFALPHMGNYELTGAWVIAKGTGSITAVAERLKPESVYDRFVAFREGLGIEVLPASGGRAARSASWRSGCGRARLSVWSVTAMSPAAASRWRSSAMGGPAALAVQTGAALMPVILQFEGDHWGVHIHEEMPVPAEGDSKQKTAAML